MRARLGPIGEHLHPIVFAPAPGSDLSPVTGSWRPGTGREAIVFLHGLGCSKHMWEPIIDMADAITPDALPYSLYAIDFPGHGDTPPAPDRRGLNGTLCHIVEVLGQIEAERIHLVAHGIATAVLLNVDPAFLGERIGTVIAVEGYLTAADCGPTIRRIASQSPRAFTAAGWADIAAELAADRTITKAVWGRWWKRSEPASVHALAAATARLSHTRQLPHAWKQLPRRAFLYGEHATISRPTRALLEGDRVDTIAQAADLPMVTSPAETLEAVIRLVVGDHDC